MESRSPLNQIIGRPDFKPFHGSRAFRVFKLAKEMVNIPPIEVNDVLKAVSSLGFLLEMEIAMIFAMQNFFCIKCGDCCRNRGSIRVNKQELERISDFKKKSYKKIKEEIRAFPLNNGSFRIPQPCKFLFGNECSIYTVRPSTCHNYPASELLKDLSTGESKNTCPIDDKLLAEIVVKRVFEERLYKENPDELKKMREQRRQDLSTLKNLSSAERINKLASSYSRYLRNDSSSTKNY